MNNDDQINTLDLTADIVASYVAHNSIPPDGLPDLIRSIDAALKGLGEASVAPAALVELIPAVPIKKSVTHEYIVCLEDGKQFRSLKRHLRTKYDLTPDAYRTKWGLPANYPMVAPAYAEKRSALAKASGLGQQRRKPVGNGRKAKAKA